MVSVVRSERPGFLTSLERMNVMLTRCKKGMVIVSNKGFLGKGGSGKSTLLGKLIAYWQLHYYANTSPWIDWRSVAEGKVNLPGVLAPTPSGLLRHTNAATSTSVTNGIDALTAQTSRLKLKPAHQPVASGSKAKPNDLASLPFTQSPTIAIPSGFPDTLKANKKKKKKGILGSKVMQDGAN